MFSLLLLLRTFTLPSHISALLSPRNVHTESSKSNQVLLGNHIKLLRVCFSTIIKHYYELYPTKAQPSLLTVDNRHLDVLNKAAKATNCPQTLIIGGFFFIHVT